jgi:thiol-disulfide isomerase/thioredoxin
MHRPCLMIWLLAAVLMVHDRLSTAESPPAAGASRAESAREKAAPATGGGKERGGKSTAAPLELTDLTGRRHLPLELGKNKAAVIIFVLQDCPISNKYAPVIQRLADEFAGQRVAFYVVHVDPELALADAKKHAKDYGYKLPVLIDRKHELVRHFEATTAPEAFVVGPDVKVLYRGRIDDRYAGVGKPRQVVRREDLRLALSAVVAGKPIEVAETKAIGCYIPELGDE